MQQIPHQLLLVLALVSFLHLLTAQESQREEYARLFDEQYLPQAEKILKRGEYRTCQLACESAINRRGQQNPRWQLVRFAAIEAQGNLRELEEELPTLLAKHPNDLPFLVEVSRIYEKIGEAEKSREVLQQFNEAALIVPIKKRSAAELVAMGTAAFRLGADPNRVLDEFYSAAKKKSPEFLGTYVAAGELALAKYDYGRAAKEYREGLKQAAQDPDLRFGLARAFFPGDRETAIAAADRALSVNPNHVEALLLKVEHLVNSENYGVAIELLDSIDLIQKANPIAWSFRSVIATLRDNDEEAAQAARIKALTVHERNPEVPHLIGRVLSRRYRFDDGAKLQREAIRWNPDFTAAKMQLASDLMRLGEEEAAWELAEEVSEVDPYNVLAFNYTKLRDQLKKYESLETDDFIIRMLPREMEIYGDRALEILDEAKEVLCKKYGLELGEPTLVEFFAEQQDFAIRTFGELGGAGYLGVCFGTVITMNSPGSSASRNNNWEATLWHEFCHVVTLTATKNRMPRWLSEGISVYEEELRNPVWGQRMTPRYRARILEENRLTAVGELSSAFLNAESGEDVMFAYFQSAMVVEFLIEEYGQEAFNAILGELAEGTPINEALTKHTEDLIWIEQGFSEFAEAAAKAYGPDVDWSVPEDVEPQDLGALQALLAENPNHFWGRQMKAIAVMREKDWPTAKRAAKELIELFPAYVEEGSGYELLATAHRALDETEEEAAVLRELAKRSADSATAYQRLLEIDLQAENWQPLLTNADRQMAVNPFIKSAHRCRACAAQALGQPEVAIQSYQKLLKLGPTSPADVNFQLATLYRDTDPKLAKRHLLESLMDAPRYREAHKMLLELQSTEKP